jgi:hypothetical protein
MMLGCMAVKNTSTSRIATIVVLIPIVIAAWFAAPWVLPVWRWQNVDVEAIAREHEKAGYTKEKLATEFEFTVYYNPRGGRNSNDPVPFQIYNCTPAWKSVYPNDVDEHELMVRATVISERDGEPISGLWIGATREESFFTIKGWRFPPGSFGKPKGRPVIVYQGFSLQKVDISPGMSMVPQTKSWDNDDEWEQRDDGYSPPQR